MKSTTRRTQLYLPDELHEAALRYAKARGLSLAAVVRIALHESLGRRTRVPRQAYAHDPVWKLLGAMKSGQRDLSTWHDHYLYGRSKTRRA